MIGKRRDQHRNSADRFCPGPGVRVGLAYGEAARLCYGGGVFDVAAPKEQGAVSLWPIGWLDANRDDSGLYRRGPDEDLVLSH